MEYYNQPEPKYLWPNYNWTDVTSDHAGAFFRALGGSGGDKSTGWGYFQAESEGPRLFQVKVEKDKTPTYENINTEHVGWSPWLNIGKVGDGKWFNEITMKFLVSKKEVRPKNMAIRIWERDP